MKKATVTKAIIVVISLTLFFSFCIKNDAIGEDYSQVFEKAIDEAYDYPITVGTKAWSELEFSSKRIALLRIPDETIANMSTEALLITILKNPYLSDIWAYDSEITGYEMTKGYVDGLSELLTRDETKDLIDNLIIQEDIIKKIELNISDDEKINYDSVVLKLKLLKDLYNYLHTNDTDSCTTKSGVYSDILTPNGSPVSYYYDLTFSSHGTTISKAQTKQANLLATYTSASVIRNVSASTAKYNCHSYAWYSSASTNKYWIDDPSLYMIDGSYSSGITYVGSILCWKTKSGVPIHSGIVYALSSGTTPTRVTSKWDYLGLIRHYTNACPYSNSNISVVISSWN